MQRQPSAGVQHSGQAKRHVPSCLMLPISTPSARAWHRAALPFHMALWGRLSTESKDILRFGGSNPTGFEAGWVSVLRLAPVACALANNGMHLGSLQSLPVPSVVSSVSTRNVQLSRAAPAWPLRAVAQRTAPLTTAFAATSEGRFPQRERVLRYPDGVERRIRYPQASYPAISYPAHSGDTDGVNHDPYRSYAEGEDPTRWENFDVAGLWGQTAPARRADPAQARRS